MCHESVRKCSSRCQRVRKSSLGIPVMASLSLENRMLGCAYGSSELRLHFPDFLVNKVTGRGSVVRQLLRVLSEHCCLLLCPLCNFFPMVDFTCCPGPHHLAGAGKLERERFLRATQNKSCPATPK